MTAMSYVCSSRSAKQLYNMITIDYVFMPKTTASETMSVVERAVLEIPLTVLTDDCRACSYVRNASRTMFSIINTRSSRPVHRLATVSRCVDMHTFVIYQKRCDLFAMQLDAGFAVPFHVLCAGSIRYNNST